MLEQFRRIRKFEWCMQILRFTNAMCFDQVGNIFHRHLGQPRISDKLRICIPHFARCSNNDLFPRCILKGIMKVQKIPKFLNLKDMREINETIVAKSLV